MKGVSSFRVTYFRGMTVLFFDIFMINKFKPDTSFWEKKNLRIALILRGIIGGSSMTLLYFTFTFAPLNEIMGIFNMNPFWATLFARIFLKEKVTLWYFIPVLFVGFLHIHHLS